MANLLLECLPAFVHEQKGEIAYAVRLDRQGDPINPAQSTVTVNNQVRPYLKEGYLFIHLPRQRVVVSREFLNSMGGGCFYEVAIRASGNPSKFREDWEEYARRHNYLRGQAFFADGEILDRRKAYDWASIHLPENARKMIQNHVDSFFRHSGLLRQLGVKPRRGLILSGPPGTGKTLLGKVLADTLGVSFMWVLPRHVKDTESFTYLLDAARFVAPAVVFLEDIDLFAEDREGNASIGLGELMNQPRRSRGQRGYCHHRHNQPAGRDREGPSQPTWAVRPYRGDRHHGRSLSAEPAPPPTGQCQHRLR